MAITEKYAIQSCTTGCYLDGRNPNHSDPWLAERPPHDMYLQWQIICLSTGTFALKSISSKKYLDGRNPREYDLLLTDRNPEEDNYLQWDAIPSSNPGRYFLKSCSSGNYLDGRYSRLPCLVEEGRCIKTEYIEWNIIRLP